MTEPLPTAPEDPPAHSPAAPPTAGGRGRVVAAALVGAVVGAAVVGAVWLAVGGDDDGDGDEPDTAALQAPATLGGFSTFESVATGMDNERAVEQASRTTAWNARTAEAVSKAYGGAAAVAATYASPDLDVMVPLIAVRASAPQPWVRYTDAGVLGLALPPDEVRTFGEVACVIRNQPTREGSEPAEDSAITTLCQRTADDLTVQVLFPGSDLGSRPAAVAILVDEAWTALAPAADGDD